MRRIVVTPAGRSRYLSLLARHLAAQRTSFDEWHVWLNTDVPTDIQLCRDLAARYSWVKLIPLNTTFNRNFSIHSFFKNCVDPSAMYLRLDDDVVWLEPEFAEKMFAFRERRPEFFLVYGNIINNAVISHIYQRCGLIDYRYGRCGYDCLDGVGWATPKFTQYLHETFLVDLAAGATSRWRCFPEWQLYLYERVSINAVAFLGSDFARFKGAVPPDEEPWLASIYPAAEQKMCAINGSALCVHFAFGPQRVLPAFDEATLLAQYEKFAPVLA
jgi:hypothetical protein